MEHATPEDDQTENGQTEDGQLEAATAPQLSAIEVRVLGALMEKQLTTPDAYPLTLNSLMMACNQKSSRDPISHYQQGELKRTLQQLEDRNFVRQEYGSRSEKFSQQFIKQLELSKKHQALLCVMMLRGPQTLSELQTRTQRMCEFADKEELDHAITRLCDRETPFTTFLGRQSGQQAGPQSGVRGERISHLFSGVPAVGSHQLQATPIDTPNQLNAEENETVELLELEVADLQKTVSNLELKTDKLESQLEALYKLTGNNPPAA